jgi:hypothetical protein
MPPCAAWREPQDVPRSAQDLGLDAAGADDQGVAAMPITPANAKLYPKDWKQIRKRMLARSCNRCEGSPAYPDCRVANGDFIRPGSPALVVLTIAHLDHDPTNCADSNLRAWCQRCHLTYDAKHHARNAYQTRRKGKAIGELI